MIDEDWLTEVINDSLDMEWTARDGARAIMRALPAPSVPSGDVEQQAIDLLCANLTPGHGGTGQCIRNGREIHVLASTALAAIRAALSQVEHIEADGQEPWPSDWRAGAARSAAAIAFAAYKAGETECPDHDNVCNAVELEIERYVAAVIGKMVPSEQPSPEIERTLSFCYALLGPGQDANAIIAANPERAAEAHRAIYERKNLGKDYGEMMARTAALSAPSGDVERVASIIREHHRTTVRQPARSNEPRKTFHSGDVVAAREILAALSAPSAGEGAVERMREMAQSVVDNAQRSYRSRGKDRYIEDEGGELMMLVPHEDWYHLQHALEALATPTTGDTPATREEDRQRGQEEGFAAAVAQLRGMSAKIPSPPLAKEASILADSLERSRLPGCDGDPCVCATPCPVEPA